METPNRANEHAVGLDGAAFAKVARGPSVSDLSRGRNRLECRVKVPSATDPQRGAVGNF